MWKEKEKKEDEETKLTEPSEEKKKKVKSCGWLWSWDPVCNFNYRNVIENIIMETESENWVMETIIQNQAKQLSIYGTHLFWMMETENWVISLKTHPIQTSSMDGQIGRCTL